MHLLLCNIFVHLDARSLGRLAQVSRKMQTLAEQDDVWILVYNNRWKGKANIIQNEIFPRAVMNDHAMEPLSTKELRMMCAAYHIQHRDFMEKTEFRAALRATWRDIGRGRDTPFLSGKFKASYACAVFDSRRNILHDDELTSFEWIFFFKQNPTAFRSTAKFHLRSGMFEMSPWPMHMHMLPQGGLPWSRTAQGHIQISQFPPHFSTRLSDNSFLIENQHVIFFQKWEGFNEQATVQELQQAADEEE